MLKKFFHVILLSSWATVASCGWSESVNADEPCCNLEIDNGSGTSVVVGYPEASTGQATTKTIESPTQRNVLHVHINGSITLKNPQGNDIEILGGKELMNNIEKPILIVCAQMEKENTLTPYCIIRN